MNPTTEVPAVSANPTSLPSQADELLEDETAVAEENRSLTRVLIVIAAAVFLASLDMFIVNIAFPSIQADFTGSSISYLSWVLNGYMIVFAALLMPFGRLADRLGRKRIFMAGLLIFTIASAACALAWSVDSLIAFRVIQGVGAAMLMSTSLALLLHHFPPARWPVAIGIWAAAGGMAAALGPPLGGLLVEASWRWVFLVNVPFAVGAWIYGRSVINESRDVNENRWPDVFGTLLLIVGVAIICWGLVKAPDYGWGSSETVVALAAGVILLAATVLRASRTPKSRIPTIELPMFANRAFSMACLTGLLFMVAFSAVLLGGILFYTSVWGYSVIQSGLAFTPGPVMAAAFAIPAGRFGARFGSGRMAALGCLFLSAGSVYWLFMMGSTPDYLVENLPGQILIGTGVGLVFPNISAAVASTLPPTQLATGSAVLSAGRQIGAVLGVSILVAIVGAIKGPATAADFHEAWIFIAATGVVAAGVGLTIGAAAALKPAKAS